MPDLDFALLLDRWNAAAPDECERFETRSGALASYILPSIGLEVGIDGAFDAADAALVLGAVKACAAARGLDMDTKVRTRRGESAATVLLMPTARATGASQSQSTSRGPAALLALAHASLSAYLDAIGA